MTEHIDPNQYAASDDDFLKELFSSTPAVPEHPANLPELKYRFTDEERMAAPDEEEVLPYLGDPEADHTPKRRVDDRPAEVRTADLFEKMPGRRKILLGVLDFCREAVEPELVYRKVDELQAEHRSVYDGPALCALLVRSGALEKVVEAAHEPKVVEVDGVSYMEPDGEVSVTYVTTQVGLDVLDADRPLERLREALQNEAVYKPIFLKILKACCEEGGKSAKELGVLVDDDPLLQNPRYWAAHFFNILGECDALSWNRTWQTTAVGLQAIEELELEGIEA